MIICKHKALLGRSGHAVGRELLAQMYREVTGENLPEIAVTDRGKPYFPHAPWHFSISHTKNHVFCALSNQNLGIDAEELTRPVKPALAHKILSPQEFAQWEAATDKKKALLTFWVLKEAAAKCTGHGLQGYPNRTDFSLNDPRVTETNGCLLAVIQEEPHAF